MNGNTITRHTAAGVQTIVRERYSYDHSGRLWKTYRKVDDEEEIIASSLSYNSLGMPVEKNYHGRKQEAGSGGGTSTKNAKYGDVIETISYLQSLDYSYNVRGQLTSINNENFDNDGFYNNDDNDLFALSLHYDQGVSGLNNEARYDGSISAAVWRSRNSTESSSGQGANTHAYSYQYDELHRLLKADYRTKSAVVSGSSWSQSSAYDVDNMSYDLHGNILTARRYSPAGIMDALKYYYRENKLIGVDDRATVKYGHDFNDHGSKYISDFPADKITTDISKLIPTAEYRYDSAGNMTFDANKGSTVAYNYLNLPVEISFKDGRRISYSYTAGGKKIRETVSDSKGNCTGSTDYCGGFIYRDLQTGGRDRGLTISTAEGRCTRKLGYADWQYEYDIKDHHGNVRVTFIEGKDGKAEVLKLASYYPFGLEMPGLCENTEVHKYGYTGNEIQKDCGLNWISLPVRNYDPQLGRFHSVDPMDQYDSPYVYCGNNPVNLVDPTGAVADGPFYWELMHGRYAVGELDGPPAVSGSMGHYLRKQMRAIESGMLTENDPGMHQFASDYWEVMNDSYNDGMDMALSRYGDKARKTHAKIYNKKHLQIIIQGVIAKVKKDIKNINNINFKPVVIYIKITKNGNGEFVLDDYAVGSVVSNNPDISLENLTIADIKAINTNGVYNEYKDAVESAADLSSTTKYDDGIIFQIHNTTEGKLADLVECVQIVLGEKTAAAELFTLATNVFNDNGCYPDIVPHSEGNEVVNAGSNLLSSDVTSNFNLISFGSPIQDFDKPWKSVDIYRFNNDIVTFPGRFNNSGISQYEYNQKKYQFHTMKGTGVVSHSFGFYLSSFFKP